MKNDSKLSKSHLDHFIQEIESTEGPLGPTFRTLFDNEDSKVFMDLLQARIRTLDKDIERLCSHYYQGFTDSIHELPNIRNDMEKLKKEVISTNADVQALSAGLLARVQDTVKYERIEGNIEISLESVKIAIPVLTTYLKLQQQLKDKRYYAALKTLEILESHHLPRVSRFDFVKQLRASVSGVRENIKMASIAELKDFLESVRKKSALLGSEAIKNQGLTTHLFDLNSVLNRLRERREKITGGPAKGKTVNLRPLSNGMSQDRVGNNPFDPVPDTGMEAALAYRIVYQGIDPSDYVDFSPVYRCLHINTILNNQEGFVDYYRKQRQKQIRLVLQPPQSQANESLDSYRTYINDVAGFFIVEDHIMTTTRKSDLVSKPYLEDLWETTSSKSIALLKTRSSYCTDAVLILELKNLIVLFCLTMKEYGFTINRIYDLLLEIRQQYHEITRMAMVQLFHQTLAQDSYAPLVALNAKAYEELVSKLTFYDGPRVDRISYPYVFPFSASLSILLDHLKVYIQTCLTFSTDLPNLSATEIDDSIRKSVVNLLTRSLSGCISALLKRNDLQTAQVAINIRYLEKAMPMLDEYISRFTRATSQGTRISGLHSKNIMKEIREETEARVKQEISVNLVDALKNAKFDWTANSVASQPSAYALQIKDFIENSILSYPNTLEHTFLKCADATLEFLGQSLLGILVSERVKSISLPALQTFQLNLNYLLENLEKVIERHNGLKSLNAFRHFIELTQLLNLLLKLDWSTYITEYGRNKGESPYSHVSSRLAAIMLEKLMLGEKQRENVLSNITSKKTERKKLNETVLKQLKQMNGTE